MTFLSIIMPVRNEAQHIGRTLKQLLQQDYPADRWEILVVDGDSTDDTCAIVEEMIEKGQRAEDRVAEGERGSMRVLKYWSSGEGKGRARESTFPTLQSFITPLTTTNHEPRTTNDEQRTKNQAQLPRITLLHNPKRLSSAARNIGVRHARGDAVLIIDGHCEIPNRRMLTNLAATFERPEGQRNRATEVRHQSTDPLPSTGRAGEAWSAPPIAHPSSPLPKTPHPRGRNVSVNHERKTTNEEQRTVSCVGRPQPLDITGATTLQRAIAAARSSRVGHHPDSFIYADRSGFVPAGSVAVAYRREVFDVVGLFDEQFDACEDYEFNTRVDKAGLACFFEPGIVVYYHPRHSLRGLFRQLARYGRGRVRMMRKHPETFSAKTLLPAAFVLGVALGWLPGLFVPWLLMTYVAVLILYTWIVLTVSASIAIDQRDLRLLVWLPAVFATIHTAAGTGLLLEAASGVRRSKPGSDGVME